MNLGRLITNSLRFRWRAHLGVVLGAAVGSAALIGALIVGDSVRESLRERALERLGDASLALHSGDRFFNDSLLADSVHTGDGRALLDDSTTKTIRHTTSGEPGKVGSVVHFVLEAGAFLNLPGTVARQDGAARANLIQVYGVTGPGAFTLPSSLKSRPGEGGSETGALNEWRARLTPEPGRVILNTALANQLNAKPGETVILRVRKPGALPQDAAISPQADTAVALRLTVQAVASHAERGDLSLDANQAPPLNAFVNLEELGSRTGVPHRANMLLLPAPAMARSDSPGLRVRRALVRLWHQYVLRRPPAPEPRTPLSPEAQVRAAAELLRRDWRLETAGLDWRLLPATGWSELSSRRVFLEPVVEAAACTPRPAFYTNHSWMPDAPEKLRLATHVTNAVRILTFLVNQVRAGTNATPYSMVTAAGAPYTPNGMRDDEILVSEWLAEDLQVRPGDSVTLTYYQPDAAVRLVEGTNTFRVRAVVPQDALHGDRTLMPEFPGLAKAESTHDWDAGFPLVHKLRDKDEQYWKQHRGTPKAFVTLSAGQQMWANRFGHLTALRWRTPPEVSTNLFLSQVQFNLLANLKPADVGLQFRLVREQALRAATQSQDFGGLFIGFSFFLIAAALILMALLFQFGVEQRVTEVGTLLALGFTPKQVRRLLLWEGAALALVGGVMGALGGVGYARLMLRGLTTMWRDAVGTSALAFHVTPVTLVIGLVAAVIVSALTIWVVLRKQGRQPTRALLAGEGELQIENCKLRIANWRRPRATRAAVIGVGCLAGAAGMVGWAMAMGETANAGAFFGAGSLCLTGGLALVSWWLGRLGGATSSSPTASGGGDKDVAAPFTLRSLAVRGCTRRRQRSLAVAALLACGVFLIASIGVFRLDATVNAWKRASGTGGFALIGQSTLPVVKDLNTVAGREFFGLEEKNLAGVSFVPLRVRDGDEASCLNLNRAQKPRLLGVKPELLAERGAFSFAKMAQGVEVTNGWMALKAEGFVVPPLGGKTVRREAKPQPPKGGTTNEIPAIGDAASIQWALGKKVGDTLDYTDERGQTFKLRLVGAVANSILQGSLVIDEAEFVKRFPGESGYRMFLVDAPSNRVEVVSAALSRALQDTGLELTPAARRLAQFNAVQNTYLNTFQVLGGLGLLLGSAGLGVVVLRNVLERRAELAVLLAVGFRRRQLHRLMLGEHAALLALGLAVGVGAALVAVLPAVWSPTMELPLGSLGATLVGVAGIGLAAAWGATWFALRGSLLEALRSE